MSDRWHVPQISQSRCAVLLCGGFGTRLGPLGERQPKALLPIAERPLLDYLLAQIVRLDGLRSIHLVSNARFFRQFVGWADSWAERLASQGLSLEVHDNGRSDPGRRRGAVADLKFAIDRIAQPTEALIASSDNLFLFSLRPIWRAFLADGRHRVLAIQEENPQALRRSAVLELGSDDRVLALHDKPIDPPTTWSCPALYLFHDGAFAHLREFLGAGHSRDALGRFVAYLAGREPVMAHIVKGHRLHLTTPGCYEQTNRLLLEMGAAGRFPGQEWLYGDKWGPQL